MEKFVFINFGVYGGYYYEKVGEEYDYGYLDFFEYGEMFIILYMLENG